MEKNLKAIVIIYSTIVALFYDPSITKIMYYSFYPNIVTAHQYRILETHINGITKSVNTIVMVCGFIWLLLAIRFTPRLKLFQQKFIVMSASYGILTFFYVFFISAAPQFFLEISKVSDTYSFRSISLQRNFFIYQTLPYILIIALVGITYSALILAKLNKKLDIAELCIAKEIDASETTSKIFCHYIKNEILSISSEVEMMKGIPEDQTFRDDILKRCEILYHRIDVIHHQTKTGYLQLKPYSIKQLLSDVLEQSHFELNGINTSIHFPAKEITVLIDPEYMSEAIQNIINNSVEAMENSTSKNKNLAISVAISNNSWVLISIQDTGKGINAHDIDKVFMPFYSSYTYSKHWGIGLTMTYKIIQAHEGKIHIRSTLGESTTVDILLPLLRLYNIETQKVK